MTALAQIQIDPETFLHHHHTLPPLPAIVGQIKSRIDSHSASIGDIARLIRVEPALTAQTLKMVNSAYYALPREISDIQYAVAFLGLNEIYRLVLALSVVGTLDIKQHEQLEAYWFHSYHTAVVARHIARNWEPLLDPEEIWSAALLHGIGTLVYLKFFPDYLTETRLYQSEAQCLPEQAQAALGFPADTELGRLVSEHWQLPGCVKTATAFHQLDQLSREMEETNQRPLKRVICCARLLVLSIQQPLNPEVRQQIEEAICSALELSAEEYLPLVAHVHETQSEARSFASMM